MTRIPGLSREVPDEALEDVSCGLCGSTDRRLKFADPPFRVVVCDGCGLTYVTPRLREGELLDAVYDEGYWSSDAAKSRGYTDYRQDEPLYVRTYRKRFSVVERHFPAPGRVLDVGCAAGYFLTVAREKGWDVLGVEPSAAICATARARLGDGAVLHGVPEELDLEPASFDLVTFWDVLEHVPDPVATVRHARGLLRPEGRILIETQNVASRAARLLGRSWQHYKHAEHIYHFDPRTIATVVERAGLRVLENRPALGGKYVSLGFVAERAGKVHPLLSALLSPLRLLERRAVYVNLFDEMIVVAASGGPASRGA